jgi:hypothetical protein
MAYYKKNNKGQLKRVFGADDVRPETVLRGLPNAFNFVPEQDQRGGGSIASSVASKELQEWSGVIATETKNHELALTVAYASTCVAHTPKTVWQEAVRNYKSLYRDFAAANSVEARATLENHREGCASYRGQPVFFGTGAVDKNGLQEKFRVATKVHHLADVVSLNVPQKKPSQLQSVQIGQPDQLAVA